MAKIRETFTRYDTADYLETEEDIAAYLNACAAEDDPALLLAALGDVARARNITQLAAQTGLTRMGLYKALSGTGNPSFATVSKVVHALRLEDHCCCCLTIRHADEARLARQSIPSFLSL